MKVMEIKDGPEASSLSVRRTGVSSAKMANDRGQGSGCVTRETEEFSAPGLGRNKEGT